MEYHLYESFCRERSGVARRCFAKAEVVGRRCSVKKGVLTNFAKFTEIHQWQSLFFNKVAVLRPVTLLKKRLWHRCFPVNVAKFLRITFLTVYLQCLHPKKPFQKFFYKKRRKVPVAVYLWKIWEIYRATCELSFLYFEPKRSKIILHKMQNLAKFLF